MPSFSNRARGLALREDYRQQAGDIGELNRMQPAQSSTQPDGWQMGRTARRNQMSLQNARGQAILDQNLDNSLRAWAQQGLQRKGQEFNQEMQTKQFNENVRRYDEQPGRAKDMATFQNKMNRENYDYEFGKNRENYDYQFGKRQAGARKWRRSRTRCRSRTRNGCASSRSKTWRSTDTR